MKNEVIEVKAAAEVVEVPSSLFTAELFARWFKFSAVKPKSQKTYHAALNVMSRYFSDNQISRPARKDLENWRDSLIAAKKSPSTVNLYLTSAKLFFRWLAQEGLYDNIGDHLKAGVKPNHEHKKSPLSAKQSAELLKAVKGNDITSSRNRAMIALMLTAGLRTIEIERANVEDLREENGITFLYVQGKGHDAKDQAVRVAPQVLSLIRAYLEARGTVDASAPLFASHSNRNRNSNLSTQSIRKIVKSYLRSIGLNDKRYSAHSLRHSAAFQMLLNGVALEQVQQVLRHVNLSTTMIYNHAVQRMKNEAELVAANAIFGAVA